MNIQSALRDIRLFCGWAGVHDIDIYLAQVELILTEAIRLGLSAEGDLETKIFACSAIPLGPRSLYDSCDPIPTIQVSPSRDSVVVEYFRRFDKKGLWERPRSGFYFYATLENMRMKWQQLRGLAAVA